MRMRLLGVVSALLCVSAAFADTVTLRSGRTVSGAFLGGTSREIRVEVNGEVQVINLSDVVRIDFSAPAPTPAAAPAPSRPTLRQGGAVDTAPTAPPANVSAELPAGTSFAIRMIDAVDSEVNRVGQTFQASLDEPVLINGEPVIERGADVVVRLVDARESGTFTGRAGLTLNLVSVKANGRVVDINTQTVLRESEGRGQQTAKTTAVGAVLGGLIGGIAGGGKGVAVGATTGGAVGAGAQTVLSGPRVRVPSETRLTFVLDTPVKI
jgi:hypothetical protein